MSDVTFQVRVPAGLLEFGLDQNGVQQHLAEWIVVSLFTEGRVSSGKAAQLLGIGRLEFLELLRNRGIAYIDYTPAELAEEFETVARFRGSGK